MNYKFINYILILIILTSCTEKNMNQENNNDDLVILTKNQESLIKNYKTKLDINYKKGLIKKGFYGKLLSVKKIEEYCYTFLDSISVQKNNETLFLFGDDSTML